MLRCPNCQFDNRQGVFYCERCGRQMPAAEYGDTVAGTQDAAGEGGYSLVVQSGSQGAQVFAIDPGRHRLGRSVNSHIRLSEPTISNNHAVINVRPEGVWIEDMNSTNGTFVNGQRITRPVWLTPGDNIQVGTTTVLRLQERVVSVPVRPLPQIAPVAVSHPGTATVRLKKRSTAWGNLILKVLALLSLGVAVGMALIYFAPRINMYLTFTPERIGRAGELAQQLVDQVYPELSKAERTVAVGTYDGVVFYIVDFVLMEEPGPMGLRVLVDRRLESVRAYEYIEVSPAQPTGE